ncbi:glutamate--cysteine ligase, partial [Legionella pneumophila]|nr:glutamate--cysteine ligase [Legionella pneumophila]
PNGLGNSEYIEELYSDVINKQNDSVLINKIYKQDGSFTKLVAAQCELWLSDSKDRKWMTQPS